MLQSHALKQRFYMRAEGSLGFCDTWYKAWLLKKLIQGFIFKPLLSLFPQGQTSLYLAAREGSLRSAKILLLNFANRNVADNMDQSPIQIARERGHHDIVELISDWTIGANSPPKAPGSTSPECQKSPNIHLHGHPTPPRCTTSPPNMIRPKMNNIAPKVSHSQGFTTNAVDKHMKPKRKRKSCSKAMQQPVRAKMNTYALSNKQINSANLNNFPRGMPISQPVSMPPTLSSSCAEVPSQRVMKMPVLKSSDNYKGALPVLSDKDIIEGFSLFDTQGCFEDLPSNWVNGETPMHPQSCQQSAMHSDNSMYVNTSLPSASIGPNDVNVNFTSRNNCSARPKLSHNHRHSKDAHKGHYRPLVVSADEIDSLNTVSHSHNMQMGPNDFHFRNINEKQLQELQSEGIQSVMQHQFPTPPSAHSGTYISSPGQSVSPQDPAATASFLTPSPDSPKRSLGGWSTSPQSSESSVC